MVSARTALLTTIGLALALACTGTTQDDSQIYAAIVEHARAEGMEVHQVRRGGALDPFLEECFGSNGLCERLQMLQQKLPGLEQETVEKFLDMQIEEKPKSLTPPALILSSVAYDSEGGQALVYATHLSTGSTSGQYYLLMKRNGEWAVTGTTVAWIT